MTDFIKKLESNKNLSFEESKSLFTNIMEGKYEEESIIKIMPNHNMPAFSSFLNDDDIWAALTFTKSTWPPQIQAKQAHQNLK